MFIGLQFNERRRRRHYHQAALQPDSHRFVGAADKKAYSKNLLIRRLMASLLSYL